jgi:hypothetical protein
MIPDRDNKLQAITHTMSTRAHEFNQRYRRGPSLYFYRRHLELRERCRDISSFLSNDYHFEILYALLVSWDMDSRRAKLKCFDEFKSNIVSCSQILQDIETSSREFDPVNADAILELLRSAFTELALMETAGRLVSNAKCLHFLFPYVCMPMDGKNTLQYLYGNTYGSAEKYREILAFSFDVMAQDVDFAQHLDDQWNPTLPKLIDNAIILLNAPSAK